MNSAPSAFEASLPALLDELSTGATPAYSEDIIRSTAGVRQRPTWTFASRWLPISSSLERAPAVALPWRTLGAVVVLLVALALAVFLVGNRPSPPPARNGLIAYEYAGDIYVADPEAEVSTAIVTDAAVDFEPRFSPDGTQIAFLRREPLTDLYAPYGVMVARPDGTAVREIGRGLYRRLQWLPDSASVLVEEVGGIQFVIDVASGDATRYLPDYPPSSWFGPLRPPLGQEALMTVPLDAPMEGPAKLIRLDRDGNETAVVVDSSAGFLVFDPAWSADGNRIAFGGTVDVERCSGGGGCPDSALYVVEADGSGLRRATVAVADWPGYQVSEAFPVWSPDSTRIAFERRFAKPLDSVARAGLYTIVRLMVVDVATGQETVVEEGDEVPYGSGYQWSPDGRSLLVTHEDFSDHLPGHGDPGNAAIVNVVTGERTDLPWTVLSGPSWQSLPAD